MCANSTKLQLLRNPDIQPTSGVIAEALREANDAYVQFVNELEGHDIQLEWRYYNDGKAWLAKGIYRRLGVRGGQKEITMFWLSVWDGFFKISIFVPEKARTALLDLSMDAEVKQMIEDSTEMGKLKFFPLGFEVSSDEMFESIFMVVDFKKRMK